MNLRCRTLNEVLNVFFNVVSDHEIHLLSFGILDVEHEAWSNIA